MVNTNVKRKGKRKSKLDSEKKPYRFWTVISDEELVDYIKSNHSGQTSRQFCENEGRAYETARKRNLLDKLADEGIIVRTARKKGTLSNMSDEDFIAYMRDNYSGRSIGEIQKTDPSLYDIARNRSLIDKLVNDHILVRQNRRGFFQRMSDDEFLNYVRQHHKTKSVSQFQNDDPSAYNVLRIRNLVDIAVEEGTLSRSRRTNFFQRMGDEEFVNYVRQNYKGLTVSQFKEKEASAYDIAHKRNLVDNLVVSGILIKSVRTKFFSHMSEAEFFDYIQKNHSGKTTTTVKEQDSQAYKVALRRGYLDKLVEEGILLRSGSSRQRSHSKKPLIGTDELSEYIRQNFSGKTISQFQRTDQTSYNRALKLGVIDDLVNEGVLIRKHKKDRSFDGMTDDQMLNYVRDNYNRTSLSELAKKDGSLYNQLLNRNLVDKLVDGGLLSRRKRKDNYFSGWTDDQIISYVSQNYNGKNLTYLAKKDGHLYGIVCERKLIDDLVDQGIVKREFRKKGFFSNMDDEQFYNYVKDHFFGETAKFVADNDPTVYDHIHKRGLVRRLIIDGVLVGRAYKMSDKQFMAFIEKDSTAKNLAVASLMLNGEATDVEQIIVGLYEGRFGDQSEVHRLIQQHSQEIYNLVRQGMTNLGVYLGQFSLGNREIVPVLLGEAIAQIPQDKFQPALEERVVRILRTNYSPRFNENPQATLSDIHTKVESSQGRLKAVYQSLYRHYDEVLAIGRELSSK